MTNNERVWMTRKAYIGLQMQLAALRAGAGSEVSNLANDTDNVTAERQARQARINRIHDLIANAIVGEDPPNDGLAEPGMVLTVRYDATGETETFLLGLRGAEDADMEVYSPQSPLGSAIVGARPGEQRRYYIPNGAKLSVTLLGAVPYGTYASSTGEPYQPVSARKSRPAVA